MTLISFNMIVLFIAVSCLLAQLFVREKHTSHIIFAVFCGSIAMVLLKDISGETIGAYKYIIGLGTVATCNGYWLLSRSLFRKKNAIESHHLALAIVISVLIFIRQGYLFVSSAELITVASDSVARQILTELTILLSSCTLVLSFWEGCRGFKKANNTEQQQRVLFLATFGIAVLLSKLPQEVFGTDPLAREWLISSIILVVLINTQTLMFWRYKNVKAKDSIAKLDATLADSSLIEEQQLAAKVKSLLVEQQLFLQPNLKVGDIAKTLDLPEYRISKALKNHLNAKNFNQYINELRIDYAQQILKEPGKQQWSVLVVGLESGFASVGPFTRAFKAQTGFTPNQFRQNYLASLSVNEGEPAL